MLDVTIGVPACSLVMSFLFFEICIFNINSEYSCLEYWFGNKTRSNGPAAKEKKWGWMERQNLLGTTNVSQVSLKQILTVVGVFFKDSALVCCYMCFI